MWGALGHCCGLQDGEYRTKKKKRRQLQTVELKVRLDCDGCELKVKKALSYLNGVQAVEINRKQQRVAVVGYVEANKLIKKINSRGINAIMWPYIPYNLHPQPYTTLVYDKKAPPGFVRNVCTGGTYDRDDDLLATMFSDDNPNSCSIM